MLFAFLQRTLIFSSLHSFRLTENCGNSTKSSQLNPPTTSPNPLTCCSCPSDVCHSRRLQSRRTHAFSWFPVYTVSQAFLDVWELNFFLFFWGYKVLVLCNVPQFMFGVSSWLDSNYAFLEKVLLCPFQMTWFLHLLWISTHLYSFPPL